MGNLSSKQKKVHPNTKERKPKEKEEPNPNKEEDLLDEDLSDEEDKKWHEEDETAHKKAKAKANKKVPIYDQNTPSPLKNTTGKFPGLIDAVKKEGAFGKPGKMKHVEKIFDKPKYNKNDPEYNKKELEKLLNETDKEERSALDWAKTLGREDIVHYLEEKREEVKETRKAGPGRHGGSRTRRKGKNNT